MSSEKLQTIVDRCNFCDTRVVIIKEPTTPFYYCPVCGKLHEIDNVEETEQYMVENWNNLKQKWGTRK